ncbi:DNA-binding transcriptional activator DecR [Ascidiaceihabitans donghaensis]|uniref:DNA-binding transcriptional activator DecR n=1 Tax=Ascidiaceihabitans donghaensis TaxID=1510460 RepID=A0A2R8BDM7_9RHOB|nr:Lrp/AsnC family transcriptional regulator [Ascidiaceihabitans donghaensis]SPH21178.1 DNA-binding transcriptional activator DecR [Ascidiaceihabitans donghaensis]
MADLDTIDRKILKHLQRDASLSLETLGEEVGLSRNACWRRVKALEDSGVITGRVALVAPLAIDLGLMVFMQVRTNQHDPDWAVRFSQATRAIPGILSVYRMTGDLDYLIRARVADMADYDRLYQQLIKRLPLSDVSASFVMEEIKDGTALPV